MGPSARSYCGKRANNVNDRNVAQYANTLIEQYRTLQPFYKADSLLVSVGDDFFFSQDGDWSITHKNYKQIFDYINSNSNTLRVKVKFSTVHEFFEDVRSQNKNYPTFTGDFFPYTEGKTGGYPYWTGFYVHRPFFKRAERLTQVRNKFLKVVFKMTCATFRANYDHMICCRCCRGIPKQLKK